MFRYLCVYILVEQLKVQERYDRASVVELLENLGEAGQQVLEEWKHERAEKKQDQPTTVR